MLDAPLPSLDRAILTPVVRRASGEPRAEVAGWEVASLGYRVVNGSTAGLWRVRGEAFAGGRAIEWSAVLKVLQRAGEGSAANFAPTDEPAAWNYWRREALAYATPHLADLAPGLVAPRLYGVAEPGETSAWLWLEDIDGVPARGWSPEDWARAARRLGRWQGRYVAGEPPRAIPDEPWLCRGHLAAWILTEAQVDLDAVRAPGAWAHPLLREHLPADTGERVARLWAARDDLLRAAGRAPATLCHLDLWSRNLLSRHIPKGANGSLGGHASDAGDATILLDWSMLGHGVLGEDVANLIFDSAWLLDVAAERFPDFERAVLDGYLGGLGDAGWDGDETTVRAAYAAIAALRFGLLAVAVLALARDEGRHALAEARYGQPIARVVAARAALVRRALALGGVD